MFPARKLAIAVWITAVAVFAMQQYNEPFLFKGMFGWSNGGISASLRSLTNAFGYPVSLATLGAIIHLLAEIRDVNAKRGNG